MDSPSFCLSLLRFSLCVCVCVLKVLFAWWGAEELGLFGSTHFVLSLSAEEITNFACDLNFDMIVSTRHPTVRTENCNIHLYSRVLPIMPG